MSSLVGVDQLLSTFGALGVFAVLFAETGLLVGFLLPGDTLLIAAGLLAATAPTSSAHLDLLPVLVAAAAGALTGAQVGFWIGRLAGPRLLDDPAHPRRTAGVQRSRALLERYGQGRAIVLARFVPVARTLMNPLAGALGMPARTFLLWQSVGGLVWSLGIVLLSYVLGSRVENVETYLVPVVGGVVLISVGSVVVGELRRRRSARADVRASSRCSP